MNVLCPNCQSSVAVAAGNTRIACTGCGFTTDLSAMGTDPGAGGLPMPLVQDLTGDTLGGYTLTERIGQGGMGVVYRARKADEDAGEARYAVKVVNAAHAWQRDTFVARFKRETEALARLSEHPHVVSILDHGVHDGTHHFLVMPFVDGPNLAHHLRAHAPLPVDEAAEILSALLSALSFAHERGVLHRDIKPANILLDPNEGVQILDFGLARIGGGLDASLTTLTRTDRILGTLNYLAPEQRTHGAREVDERADVFALGVVFYEMLTGKLPIGHFPPASRVRPDRDRRFDALLDAALHVDPEARIASADAFAAALEGARRGGMRRTTLFAMSAVLLGVVTVLALFASGVFDPEPEPAPSEPESTVSELGAVLDEGPVLRAEEDANPAPPASESVAEASGSEREPEPPSRAALMTGDAVRDAVPLPAALLAPSARPLEPAISEPPRKTLAASSGSSSGSSSSSSEKVSSAPKKKEIEKKKKSPSRKKKSKKDDEVSLEK